MRFAAITHELGPLDRVHGAARVTYLLVCNLAPLEDWRNSGRYRLIVSTVSSLLLAITANHLCTEDTVLTCHAMFRITGLVGKLTAPLSIASREGIGPSPLRPINAGLSREGLNDTLASR